MSEGAVRKGVVRALLKTAPMLEEVDGMAVQVLLATCCVKLVSPICVHSIMTRLICR